MPGETSTGRARHSETRTPSRPLPAATCCARQSRDRRRRRAVRGPGKKCRRAATGRRLRRGPVRRTGCPGRVGRAVSARRVRRLGSASPATRSTDPPGGPRDRRCGRCRDGRLAGCGCAGGGGGRASAVARAGAPAADACVRRGRRPGRSSHVVPRPAASPRRRNGIDPSGEATDLYEEFSAAPWRGGRAAPDDVRRWQPLPSSGENAERELLSAFGNDGRVARGGGAVGIGESHCSSRSLPPAIGRCCFAGPDAREGRGIRPRAHLVHSAPGPGPGHPCHAVGDHAGGAAWLVSRCRSRTCRKRRSEIAASADPAGRVAGDRSHRALTRRRRRPAVGRL